MGTMRFLEVVLSFFFLVQMLMTLNAKYFVNLTSLLNFVHFTFCIILESLVLEIFNSN